MGTKHTAKPQGLKVKERTDHYDYKDIFKDTVLVIYYDSWTWTIKSAYDRLWMNGVQYLKGDTIAEFQDGYEGTYKVLGQYDEPGTVAYRNIFYNITVYSGTDGIGNKTHVKITGGDIPIDFDKDNICFDILHTHTKVYYNGHYHDAMFLVYDNPSVANCWMKRIESIALTYADPFWFLMTTQSGVEYNGQTYEARKLIRSWKSEDSVDMTLRYTTSRKRDLPNPKEDKFDKIVYDVQCFAPDGHVVLSREVNGIVDDSTDFYPSDSPVTFHNIQFRASSDKWTIFSKCGYIKYSGRTYPNNRSIVSIGFDENLHIEITDQSNVYEIKKQTIYRVKTQALASVTYRIWISEITKAVKIEKSTNSVAEPWITVNYYDAMYSPYNSDDLNIEFDNIDWVWYLRSNSDELYSDGQNYRKGELIATWHYNDTSLKLEHITVLQDDETGIEIKVSSSGDVPYIGNDIDEIYDDGLKICHSYSKGIWEIKSINDRTFYNGIQFLEGQTIITLKDGIVKDQSSILVEKIVDGSQINVMYYFYTNVDIIKNITQLHINDASWSNKEVSNENDTIVLTKDIAKSMYGYIWRKQKEPGPTPIDVYTYFFVPIDVTGANGYRYIAAIRVSFGHRQVLKFCGNSSYNRISVSDEFFIFNSLSQVLYHYHGYFPQYKAIGNPLNSIMWSYIGSSFPPYPYSLDRTYLNYKKVYLNKNNQYMYIAIREDEELVEEVPIYTYTIKKLIFTSENMSEVISETTNSVEYGLYEDFIYAGSNVDPKLQYLDKGDSLIVFDNNHEFIRFYDWWEPQYVSGILSISSLSFEKLNVCRRLDITRDGIIDRTKQLYPEFADSESYYSRIINIGRIDKYILCAISVEISYDDLYAYIYFAYKYNIETGGVEYVGNFARKSNNGVIYYDDIPWKDVMFTFNGKGYNYSRDDDNLYVYEINDPEDFDEVYVNNSWTLVNTLSESACEVSIIDLQNYTYRTVNLYSAFGNNLIKSIGYNTSDSKYHHYNNEGIFVWENLSGQSGKLITYLPDPTLNSFSAAFCFPANALRYSNELNEEWFQNN